MVAGHTVSPVSTLHPAQRVILVLFDNLAGVSDFVLHEGPTFCNEVFQLGDLLGGQCSVELRMQSCRPIPRCRCGILRDSE